MRRPPTTPVRRVDFLLQREIEMGERSRETERDIGDNQSEIVLSILNKTNKTK